ncbi:MAG: hypothetical protein AB7T59_03810 [Hyphomonadaceae bacterium]
MTEHEVHEAMSARRFRLHNPTDEKGAGFFISADERVWMLLGYTEGRRDRILTSYTYHVHYTAEDVSDIEARRSDLIGLLGRPTHWVRWTNERNEIGDRFSYVSRRAHVAMLDSAGFCYANWECASLFRELGCRPIVRRVRGPVIEGSFGYRMLYLRVHDYGPDARQLQSNTAFRRRDLSNSVCLIPSIH